MSLKSFHIVFATITTVLFLFLSVFYGMMYLNSEEISNALLSAVNLLIAGGGIYYCKTFIEKHKSISNL